MNTIIALMCSLNEFINESFIVFSQLKSLEPRLSAFAGAICTMTLLEGGSGCSMQASPSKRCSAKITTARITE